MSDDAPGTWGPPEPLPDGDLTAPGEAEVVAALSARASGLDAEQARVGAALAIPQFKMLVALHRWRTSKAATAATVGDLQVSRGRLAQLSIALDGALEAARVSADVLRVLLPSHRRWLDEWAFHTGALQAIAEHAAATTESSARRPRGPAVDALRYDLEGAVADVLGMIGVPLTKYRNGTLARCLRVVYPAATGLKWPSDPKDVLTRLVDVERRGAAKWTVSIDENGDLSARRSE